MELCIGTSEEGAAGLAPRSAELCAGCCSVSSALAFDMTGLLPGGREWGGGGGGGGTVGESGVCGCVGVAQGERVCVTRVCLSTNNLVAVSTHCECCSRGSVGCTCCAPLKMKESLSLRCWYTNTCIYPPTYQPARNFLYTTLPASICYV